MDDVGLAFLNNPLPYDEIVEENQSTGFFAKLKAVLNSSASLMPASHVAATDLAEQAATSNRQSVLHLDGEGEKPFSSENHEHRQPRHRELDQTTDDNQDEDNDHILFTTSQDAAEISTPRQPKRSSSASWKGDLSSREISQKIQDIVQKMTIVRRPAIWFGHYKNEQSQVLLDPQTHLYVCDRLSSM